jgi:hypothetical protein
LQVSANVSYARTEKDVEILTGIRVSAKTQQRLVQGFEFAQPSTTPDSPVSELSVDGGKVRLRTPLGKACIWRDYKAIATDIGIVANFQNNLSLTNWVNGEPWATPTTCLGDGHDGIWNIIELIGSAEQRREILDWYHLVENLHKVGGSLKRLAAAEALLWQGKVDETLVLFENLNRKQAHNFCDYLTKHRHRIVNYDYYQAENICSIGSGAVESAIKQIGQRVKISGAQWEAKNVPQVLAHRAAYLNELLFSS